MENRKTRYVNTIAMISALLLAMTLVVPRVSAQPKIDILRYKVITNPDERIEAMQDCSVDVLTNLERAWYVEKMDTEGFTVVYTGSFYIFFIGFNIRQQIPLWPLADVDFRHALAHSFARYEEVAFFGRFIKIASGSMVPPTLSRWHNPNVDSHPRDVCGADLGDPFDITSLVRDAEAGQVIVNVADASIFEEGDSVWIADESAEDNLEINVVADVISNQLTLETALANTYTVAANGVVAMHEENTTCSILREARYEFVDADDDGTVSPADYWEMPNGEPLPEVQILVPRWELDPLSHALVEGWLYGFCIGITYIRGLKDIGLASSVGNNWSGFRPEITDFLWHRVYNSQLFDAFVIGFDLDRFPDYLYDWFHSSQDFPGGGNCFGVHDQVLDDLLETMKFSLDPWGKLQATWDAQERLAEVIATIPVYTEWKFDAFQPGLLGIVNSPGYCADNLWTHLNIHWEIGPPIQDVVWCLKGEPDIFNPLSGNAYAWEFMERVFDPLMAVNPYNDADVPWIATDWMVVQTPTGMDVTYYLRDNVFRQDGLQCSAWDAEFSLEFIRDNQIPRFKQAWQNIIDVEVIDDFTFTVHANATGLFLIYEWGTLATLLPPEVWADWDGKPLDEILARDLSLEPGWNGETPTNLFGTGPFIFQSYDDVELYGDLYTNQNYFLTTEELHDLKVEMFHKVGDANREGYIDIIDLSLIGISYGCWWFDPCYNSDADLNQDGIIDIADISICAIHFGEQREYPVPTEDP